MVSELYPCSYLVESRRLTDDQRRSAAAPPVPYLKRKDRNPALDPIIHPNIQGPTVFTEVLWHSHDYMKLYAN